MNWPYLHLVSNHFPIILAVVGAAALLAGRLLGRPAAMRYGAVCLVVAALAAPVAYVTGLQAEEPVEEMWYAAEAAIEEHEELGLWALLVTLASGAAALAWLRRGGRLLEGLVLVAGPAAAVVLVLTAWQGGHIVHGSDALAAPPAAQNTSIGGM